MESRASPSQFFKFTTVDVFTTELYKGNQLAVVRLPSGFTIAALKSAVKQKIAEEFKLSETVFLEWKDGETSGADEGWHMAIFTEEEELPFAGHPTIGALCYIGMTSRIPSSGEIRLRIKAGMVEGHYDQATGMAKADIPHNVHVHSQRVALAEHYLDTLPEQPSSSGDASAAGSPLVSIVKGLTFTLVELLQVESGLSQLKPVHQRVDTTKIALDEHWDHSFVAVYYYVILPSPADSHKIHIRTRMFEQSIGEDAATGSAACTLAAYLTLKRGGPGKTLEFIIQQGVEMGRPSNIHVKVSLNGTGTAVQQIVLSGSAVLVADGRIRVPTG